jgi:hypothetical protein
MAETGSVIFDVMLKEAVTENFRERMNAMPSEEELLRAHPPSEEHTRKMNALFARERRRSAARKVWSFTKAAVMFVCVLAAIAFALLMANPEIRAAVWDVIIQVREGHLRIVFTETGTPSREARDFSLKYIPEGYTLESVDEYGPNCMTIYMDADGKMLVLNVSLPDAQGFDNENLEFYTETHDGITYYIFESYDIEQYQSGIAWMNEGFVFNVSGMFPIHELFEIAFSLGI